MSKLILTNFLTIFKYQLFGLKATADSSFYRLITLNIYLGIFDAFAFVSLLFHTFIALPLAFLFNATVLFLIWTFDHNGYNERLKIVETAYVANATLIKEQYRIYIESLK